MGIASWFLSIGIRAEETVEHLGTRRGSVPLQWPAGHQPDSIVYRLPRDRSKRASIFSDNQTIIINEGEAGVVIAEGKAGSALPPGRYSFEKGRITGALDIVWVRTGQQTVRWGVGNVTSADGAQIGANGVMYVKIADPTAFNAEVVQGGLTLSEADLQRFLLPRIQGVLRSCIAGWPAMELQVKRTEFSEAVSGALFQPMGEMGIEVVDFEVTEVNLPAELKAALGRGLVAQHGGQADLIEAQNAAQIAQIQAQASANTKLLEGMADVQLLTAMQQQGIDPLKVKALEALNTMAANPSQGVGLVGGDMARAQLFGSVAGAALQGGLPGSAVGQAPPAQLQGGQAVAPPPAAPAVAAAEAAEDGAPEGASDPAAQLADYEAQLDKLVERVAEGEISETLYEKLSARLEQKIEALKSED
jgi:regulator of protease activity HflC (stomatin/prohibitin superfamily)